MLTWRCFDLSDTPTWKKKNVKIGLKSATIYLIYCEGYEKCRETELDEHVASAATR